jgi:pimeloyl-ACP methyl ester carboxylesterase
VIICPGFWQSKDTPTFRRMSEALAADHDVLAMDFRGHGRSSGFYTFSAREGTDLEAVLDAAQGEYAWVGLVGFSMGAAISIITARRRRETVHRLVAVSAPSAFEQVEFKWWTPEAMRTGLRGMEPGAGCRPGNLLLKKERALDHVAALAGVPVLFVHGTRDAIVGVEHSRRLYAVAAEPKRLEIFEGAGHAEDLFRQEPGRFLRIVRGWFSGTPA